MKKWIGACAAAALLVGCGGGNGEVKQCTAERVDDTVTIRCPDGSQVELHDGQKGADGIDGQNGIDGNDGQDGQDGTNGTDGTDGTDGTNGTSCTVQDQGNGTKLISCDDGTSVVVNDGVNGANGHDALITVETEPVGANCANGGTAVKAGVDLNDDGVLDASEVTSTSYICRENPYQMETSFSGFEALQSGLRSEVEISSRIYGTIDPATLVRWRTEVTDENQQPVSGVRSYYATPADGPDHTTWTQYVETDANGVTWFGPASGFSLAQGGLTNVGGSTLPFSVLSPSAFNGVLHLQLIRLSDNAVIGGADANVTVTEGSTAMVFNGFDALSSSARGLVTINARLTSSYDPNALLRWRVTLSRDGAPAANQRAWYPLPGEQTAAHTSWTGAFDTDASGVAWFGPATGFTATQAGLQQPSGTTTPFSIQFSSGHHQLQLELVELAGMTVVGSDVVEFDVP